MTYYYRVRARNGSGVFTEFAAAVSTLTAGVGTIPAGSSSTVINGVTVTKDPGTTITLTTLADGSIQQTLESTGTATVTYGGGAITLVLTGGVDVNVVVTNDGYLITSTAPLALGDASSTGGNLSVESGGLSVKVTTSAEGLILVSTGSLSCTNSGFTIETTSGGVKIQTTEDSLNVVLSTDAPQNLQTAIPTTGTKSVAITLRHPSGRPLKASIPPGALKENVRLRIKLPDTFPSITAALHSAPGTSLAAENPHGAFTMGAPAVMNGTGIGIEITLDRAIQPSKPIPIVLGYSVTTLAGRNPDQLNIARFDETAQKWVGLKTSVDASTFTASASTLHFSRFQLMYVTPSQDVDSAKVYPNPARTHQGHTEMTFINLSANASLKIYTYLGEKVADLVADVTGTVRWDLKNVQGEKVASGVYIAYIEGGNNSKKTMKIAVEK